MAETDLPRRAGGLAALAIIWPFVRPYLGLLGLAVLVLLVTAGIALTLPYAFRLVIDGFETATAAQHNRIFALAIAAVALLAVGSAVRNYLTRLLSERAGLDMRKAIFARAIRMSPAFFERMMTGEILSRITSDTTLILMVIGNSTALAMRHSVMMVGGLIMLFITSPKLMGLVVLIVPLIMGPIIAIGNRVRANAAENQKWIAQSSAHAAEALQAAPAFQAFSAEAQAIQGFDGMTARAVRAARRAVQSHAIMTGTVILFVFCGMAGVLWVGASDVRAEALSVGELVQFAFYSIIVATSFAAFSDVWGEAQRAGGAAERLDVILRAVDSVHDPVAEAPALPRPTGALAFEDVRFFYPSRPAHPALDGVSFAVAPGETVALVGPSGAGKSTVFQLLLRFFDPAAGRITVDGHDIGQIARAELRSHLAIVQQDPAIFSGSAAENIAFGRPGASRAEIEAAAEAAAAHGFICALPDGFDTDLGARGVMLSGGQKQRIAIARAILRDAPILLLDEATSALDAESEAAIQHAVQRLAADRTTLIVAHRLATVEKADRILVFDAGRIVAAGTHAELVAQGGLYARYAQMQLIAP